MLLMKPNCEKCDWPLSTDCKDIIIAVMNVLLQTMCFGKKMCATIVVEALKFDPNKILRQLANSDG